MSSHVTPGFGYSVKPLIGKILQFVPGCPSGSAMVSFKGN